MFRTTTLRALLVVTALTAAGAADARAQSLRNYGSLYSYYGLGERVEFGSSQTQAMGGAGVAVRSLSYNGLQNPALWADQALAQVTASARYEGVRIEDETQEQSRLGGGSLEAVQLGLPLYNGRLGVTFAFRPYTRVTYLAQRSGVLTGQPEFATDLPYAINYEGNGGLQLFQAGAGYRLTPNLAVGASVDVLFGVLEYRQRTAFPELTTFAERTLTQRTRLSGVRPTAGVVYSRAGVFGQRDALSFGATVSAPARLGGERTTTLDLQLDIDQDTLGAAARGNVTLPLTAVLGVAYLPSPQWTLALDGLYEPWGGFESDFSLGGFDAAGASHLGDRWRVGGGFQFRPTADRSRPYVQRVAYRLGGYAERHLARSATGGTVETYAGTAGLSLPTLYPTAFLDFNAEGGVRGAAEPGLVRELFIRVTATLNFGERWFGRRKLD